MERQHWQLRNALALGLCMMVLAGTAMAASTVTPADKLGEKWWAERHAGVLEQVKGGNVDLILLGD